MPFGKQLPRLAGRLHAFRSSVEKAAPGAMLIGEVWDPSPGELRLTSPTRWT